MQSYQNEKLTLTEVGSQEELVRKMQEQATHHIIGKIPRAGTEVTINGLVWVVEKSNAQRGWMRLRLKEPAAQVLSDRTE